MTSTDPPDTSGTADVLALFPFRGVRYAPDKVSSLAAVTSPPYDVVVRPDGIHYLQTADPHNVVRLILPQSPSPDPAERHRLAARTLRQWQRDGILTPDPEPALYVYEQRADGLLQRGVIGALALDSPVLPHEDVMPSTVADRAGLMRATRANLEPLLLAYRSNHGSPAGDGAAAVIERATTRTEQLATRTEDGIEHRLWAVTDPAEIRTVSADLARCQALIADGHHRWATYRLLRRERPGPGRSPWDLGLVLLVDTARYPLRVRAIHRVLYRLPVRKALDAARGSFTVQQVDAPLDRALEALADAAQAGNALLLTGDGTYHLLTAPDPALLSSAIPADRPEAWRRLDATVLHGLLLDRVWGIPDSPDHIGYLHDTAAAVEQAQRHGGTAVLMHPVEERVVRGLAERGVTMPRKSTSFGPKPATGLVLRDLTLG